MTTIEWKPQAWRDLEAIEEYYLKVAPQYGDVFIDEVLAAIRRLERSPRSGRIVPEIDDPQIREVLYHNYRIIYFYEEESDAVEVLTVFHAWCPPIWRIISIVEWPFLSRGSQNESMKPFIEREESRRTIFYWFQHRV